MGILLAFAVGYVVGARAGAEGLEDVVASAKALRESEEFNALLRAIRSHVASSLTELGTQLGADPGEPIEVKDLLERVRTMVRRGDATTPAF